MKKYSRIALLVAVGMVVLGVAAWMSTRFAVQAQAPAQAPAEGRGQQAPVPPDPSTQRPEHLMTRDQVLEYEKTLSNWGRWGPRDQKGALNLITQAKSKQAIALAREGVYASLHHFIEPTPAVDNQNMGTEFKHWNTTVNAKTGKPGGGLDAISFAIHDGGDSHMDALCHYQVETSKKATPLNFGGVTQELTMEGCKFASIDNMGKAYITRGILIDMPLLKGVKYLEPHTAIYVSDLEAWEKFANLKIGAGDAIFLRTGKWAMRAEKGPWNAAREIAGLHASVLPWIKQRDISILAGEGVIDAQPSGVEGIGRPIHVIALTIIGAPTVDNAYMEDVAAIAARLKRWEFMLSYAPIQVPDGTATPFTALAVF